MKTFRRFLPLLIIIYIFLPACLSQTLNPAFDRLARPGEAQKEAPDGTLQIEWPYVGQGDGTLIITPSGRTILIDSGPPTSGPAGLHARISALGINQIDALIITHYDLDHLGGVAGLLPGPDKVPETEDDIHVLGAYDHGGDPLESSPGYENYLAALAQYQVPHMVMRPGDSLDLDPAVSINCLAAAGQVVNADGLTGVDLSPATYVGKENAASIALLIQFGEFRYLTSGDLTGGGYQSGFLTPDVETLLSEAVGPVDVVHANHHGSASSSNASFIAATKPTSVIFQAGINNPYGHPAVEVVERWADSGAEIYSTVTGSGYLLSSDGVGFRVEETK